jgi:hypothetical protein
MAVQTEKNWKKLAIDDSLSMPVLAYFGAMPWGLPTANLPQRDETQTM